MLEQVTILRPLKGTGRDFLESMRQRVKDVEHRLQRIDTGAEIVHQAWIADRKRDFATRGATTAHGAWRANHPATIAAKGHHRVLLGKPADGFQLYRSIVDERHPDHIFFVGFDTIEIGTRHWKAQVHAQGSRGLPRRRAVDPTDRDRRRYADLFARYVLGGD